MASEQPYEKSECEYRDEYGEIDRVVIPRFLDRKNILK
jgi:hypothetical protein